MTLQFFQILGFLEQSSVRFPIAESIAELCWIWLTLIILYFILLKSVVCTPKLSALLSSQGFPNRLVSLGFSLFGSPPVSLGLVL